MKIFEELDICLALILAFGVILANMLTFLSSYLVENKSKSNIKAYFSLLKYFTNFTNQSLPCGDFLVTSPVKVLWS